MAKKEPTQPKGEIRVSSSVEDLLASALARGDESLETGRYIVTFKENAGDEALKSLGTHGLRVADTRDFTDQAITLEDAGDADLVVFPEVGAAVISGAALEQRSMSVLADGSDDSPIETIEPEYFAFADADAVGYLRGFRRAVETIAQDLRPGEEETEVDPAEDPLVIGATWGLIKCKVPPSVRSGVGIKVAMLDTGFDLGHPDFAGRPIVGQTFVGQPVQDLHGHGTHTCGTATGPKAPAGAIPRYGIAYRAPIFIGKVLNNSGGGTTATVLAGMNWAIANRCPVISMSLGAQTGVQAAYTAAGAAALNKGLLIIAAAGNSSGLPTGAPANSPTIMAVSSLDPTLVPSAFNSVGKIEIAAPGRDVFSSWPRPLKYKTISGTSMATPHVSGCAALWAESSIALRGLTLWKRLQATAKPLPFPASRVGRGLVQAP
jgi:subtilisin family serine protease